MIYTPEVFVDRVFPDQKIHTQTSGRWSTTDPPLAQLPRTVKQIICPDPGWCWVKFDFDQIEPRLSAALANDVPSLEWFAKGYDYHTLNMCDFLEIEQPPDLIDPHKAESCTEWRQKLEWGGKDDIRRKFAKSFSLRLDYGGDPGSAGDVPGAKHLGFTSARLVRAANSFLASHPAKAAYRRRIREEALRTRTIRTFLGRRRKLSGEPEDIIREAFNHPMQGGVADIFNLTLIRIRESLDPKVKWVVGCHDSQTWACLEQDYTYCRSVIQEIILQPWSVYGVSVVLPATFE